jgi:hypothetical protein
MKNWFKKKDKVTPVYKDPMLPTHPIQHHCVDPFRVDDLHFKGLLKDTLSREDIMYIMKVISDYQLLVESFEKEQKELRNTIEILLEKSYGKDWREKYETKKFRKKHRDFILSCKDRVSYSFLAIPKFRSFIPELFILLRPDLYKDENQLKYTIIQQDINEEKP